MLGWQCREEADGCLIAITLAIVSSEFFGFFAGKDLSVTVMLNVQGAM